MKIGFIGAGQMAQALAGGISENGGSPNTSGESYQQVKFVISDPGDVARQSFTERTGDGSTVVQAESNQQVVSSCDVVFLAVKPQMIAAALDEVSVEGKGPLVISIVAGVTCESLRQMTGSSRIVRVMPNTPCLIGCGAAGLAGDAGVSDEDIETVKGLLEPVSIVEVVSENYLDVVTGLSGSGPAYVFTFIEALADGGVLNGLPRDVATRLAIQTVFGAADLARQSTEHIAALRDRVTSPGGTTIAGLEALEKSGFRHSAMSAVTAATNRSRELGG